MSSTLTPLEDPTGLHVSRPARRTPVAVVTATTALAVGLLLAVTAGLVSRSARTHDRATRDGAPGDERGLSQSAETAILLAGAVVVAGIVVTVITAFVKSKLPK